MNEKKAIVVGATSGIGLEVAKILAEKGWKVGIAGRRELLLNDIMKSTPNIIAYQRIDVTSENCTIHLQNLIDSMEGIDMYFHSSGIGYQNPELDFEKEVNTVETNTLGFTRMVNHAFNYFTQHTDKEVHIAVISSIAGTKGLGAAPAYSASKRFVNHYMECLAQLCSIRNIRHIRFHDIRPGFVRTALLGDGGDYPLQLDPGEVAKDIVKGIEKNKDIITIDWRYRILVFFWRMVPRWLWIRMKISTK